MKQGDVGSKFYIIKSGRVEVSVRDDIAKSPTGKNQAQENSPTLGTEKIVAYLSEGDYFGEIALLEDVPRTTTCRAITAVEVWVLSKRDFNQLVRKHLDIPQKLDRAVADMIILKRMPLFRELTYKQINMVSSKLRSKTVPPRTAIVREGEQGDAFYIIRSGEVIVTARSGMEETAVGKLGEGEFFGEIALVTDRPRIATVTSTSQTELLILGKSDFDTVVGLISSDLEQAGSRRLLDTRRKLSNMSKESLATDG
jgi:CRP-like cAMP-binding protein